MNIRQAWLTALFAALTAVGLRVDAVAAITTSNIATLPSPDGENITSDSLTGFEWLDPAVTLNRSFNEVSALLQNDPHYAGFRFATRDEVIELLTHLPTPVAANSSPYAVLATPDLGASANAFFAFVGTTSTGLVRGITADVPVLNPTNAHYVFSVASVNGPTETRGQFTSINLTPSTITGSWLVRDNPTAVPEPGSMLIWCLLVSCAAMRVHVVSRQVAEPRT